MLTIQHRYDNLGDFVTECKRRANRNLSSHTGSEHFTKTYSFTESLDLAIDGWDGPRENVKRVANEVTTQVRKHLTPRITRQPGNRGRKVLAGRMAQGHPQQFVRTVRTEGESHRRTARVLLNGCFSAGVETDTITKVGAALLSLVDALATLGVSTEVTVAFCVSGTGESYGTAVKLKGYNDPAGIDRLMFAVAHPSMLRRLQFAHMEGESPKVQRALRVGNGYGSVLPPQVNGETFDITMGVNTYGVTSDPVAWVLGQIEGLGL